MAVEFDGTNDYVMVKAGAILDPSGNFSAAAWVYSDGASDDIWYNEGGVPTPYAALQFGIISPTPILRFFGRNDAAATVTVSGSAITTGQWNHVAITRSGTAWVLYINGVANSQTATLPAAPYTITSAVFGIEKYSTELFSPLDGKEEDVRVYNRLLTAILGTRLGA